MQLMTYETIFYFWDVNICYDLRSAVININVYKKADSLDTKNSNLNMPKELTWQDHIDQNENGAGSKMLSKMANDFRWNGYDTAVSSVPVSGLTHRGRVTHLSMG